MRQILVGSVCALLLATSLSAQSAISFEKLAVADTAVNFAAATYFVSGTLRAERCVGVVELGAVRYRTDGTAATASIGNLADLGATIELVGLDAIRKFSVIRVTTTSAAINFSCYATATGGVSVTPTASGLADNAVTTGKILDGTIVVGDLADGAVTTGKILDGTIATADIATGAVTTATILDATVASADLAETTVQYAEVAISSAAIVGTSAGQLSHADGVVLVAAPASGKALEFISAVLIYDYAGAGYGAGDPLYIAYAGGSAISSAVAAANSLGATSDKIVQFVPLAVNANAMAAATGLNLVTTSGTDWTLGSATGVVRVKIAYRVHTTGL